MPRWRMQCIRISFIHTFILHRTYFFHSREVCSSSNVVATIYAISDAACYPDDLDELVQVCLQTYIKDSLCHAGCLWGHIVQSDKQQGFIGTEISHSENGV